MQSQRQAAVQSGSGNLGASWLRKRLRLSVAAAWHIDLPGTTLAACHGSFGTRVLRGFLMFIIVPSMELHWFAQRENDPDEIQQQ